MAKKTKAKKNKTTWVRYRFYTGSADDPRPIIFNPAYPWWCSGFGNNTAIIVAWLPNGERLTKYWDDASDIDSDEAEEIYFTDRFPRPKWYKPLKEVKP